MRQMPAVAMRHWAVAHKHLMWMPMAMVYAIIATPQRKARRLLTSMVMAYAIIAIRVLAAMVVPVRVVKRLWMKTTTASVTIEALNAVAHHVAMQLLKVHAMALVTVLVHITVMARAVWGLAANNAQ